jgi:hypothetical protein
MRPRKASVGKRRSGPRAAPANMASAATAAVARPSQTHTIPRDPGDGIPRLRGWREASSLLVAAFFAKDSRRDEGLARTSAPTLVLDEDALIAARQSA